MKSILVKSSSSLKGDISLAGDKSIAHRSIILSAITPGETRIKNFPLNQDCLSTINSFKKLGIRISRSAGNSFTVFGKGINGLKKPNSPIFVGDSGTTMRLLAGVLAGQDFSVTLKAGRSLAKRPMLRITAPLRMMGAKISARRLPCRQAGKAQGLGQEEYPPLTISGGGLRAISYKVPVASAQVKSAIL
ncbi:MAG: 3-phosphoshikimate 1-carboxyvinyltransferase, partial [bacterium]